MPERTCIATREVRPQADLLRMVAVPTVDGTLTVMVDWAGKVPGRGAWLTPSASAIETAVKRSAFKRAFKAPVEVDAGALIELVEDGLRTALVRRISLARRAGKVSEGEGRAKESVQDGKCRFLLMANDISAGNATKYRRNAERKDIPVAAPLAGAALGSCFGKPFCSLVSIEAEPFAGDVARLASQIRMFRNPEEA